MALFKKKRNVVYQQISDSDEPIGDTLVLDKPTVPLIIDTSDPEGLLPTGTQNSDLLVYIPRRWRFPAGMGEQDRVQLYWRNSSGDRLVQTYIFDGPVEESLFPYEMSVPKNLLQPDGRYEIWYVVRLENGTSTPSFETVVTLDTQAPGYDKQPEALLYPADLIGTLITESYLLSHSDRVELSVPLPLYTGAADGDILSLWWSQNNPPAGSWVAQKTITQAEISAQDIRVDLSGDVIRAPGINGPFHAFYKLRDRAGNETLVYSKPATATVSLLPLPILRPPPRVPLHEDDNLLHRADARAQVKALVDGIDNLQPNDEIRLDWNGTQLAPVQAILPVTIDVPWNTLIARGLGPMVVPVRYDILRAGGVIGGSDGVTDININFTVAGQDHSGAPALINPRLELIEILGESGVPNVLIPTDRFHPVIPRLKLYENPMVGEVLELYWGAQPGPVATYVVQPGDSEGQWVSFSTVPTSIIDQDPNNSRLPVYYTTSNGINQQESLATEVNVQFTTISGLPAPTFPSATIFGFLDCCSVPRLWEGVRVVIAGNSNFDQGDTIILTWQGDGSLNGTEPIRGARGTFTKVLTHSETVDGFEIRVAPYEALIMPMVNNGSATAYYRLMKANGGYGESRLGLVKINRTWPSGGVCDASNIDEFCPPLP